MITKLFLKILLGNKKSLTKAIELKGRTYLLNIEEYKPINKIIQDLQEKVL